MADISKPPVTLYPSRPFIYFVLVKSQARTSIDTALAVWNHPCYMKYLHCPLYYQVDELTPLEQLVKEAKYDKVSEEMLVRLCSIKQRNMVDRKRLTRPAGCSDWLFES